MRSHILFFIALLTAACTSSGGGIVRTDQTEIPPGKAIIAFSAEIADGTEFVQCSLFLGKSAASAKWFGWNVAASPTWIFALEVEASDYGFHRFGCIYRGLTLSTSVPGPRLDLQSGEVTYLGRLTVRDTEFGTAAGHSRMVNAVNLVFEDRSEVDLDALKTRYPLFLNMEIKADVPGPWCGTEKCTLRPYQHGPQIIIAPVM